MDVIDFRQLSMMPLKYTIDKHYLNEWQVLGLHFEWDGFPPSLPKSSSVLPYYRWSREYFSSIDNFSAPGKILCPGYFSLQER
jgi:hypothetical protein